MASLSKISCIACGYPIWRDRGRINENFKLKHNSYCSRVCESLYKTKKRIIFCDNPDCRKEFSRVPNDILLHNYCSHACAAHVNNQIIEIYPEDLYPNIAREDKLSGLLKK